MNKFIKNNYASFRASRTASPEGQTLHANPNSYGWAFQCEFVVHGTRLQCQRKEKPIWTKAPQNLKSSIPNREWFWCSPVLGRERSGEDIAPVVADIACRPLNGWQMGRQKAGTYGDLMGPAGRGLA